MKASVGFLEKLTKQKRLTEKEKTQLTEIRNETGIIQQQLHKFVMRSQGLTHEECPEQ